MCMERHALTGDMSSQLPGQLDESRPIFILCAARSGSTLLRLILDTHPEIACPPELNLVLAFEAIQFSCQHALAADLSSSDIQGTATALCRDVAGRIIGAYAALQGKGRWCEKSLPSAEYADLLLQIFPQAQFICLYRECTDTVASALEACPWGFGGYGLEPYVRSTPGNLVLGIANYWADRADRQLRFESEHPDQCHRVRYEDLVLAPTSSLPALFHFLGIGQDHACVDPDTLTRHDAGASPGDYKIRYTEGYDPRSVGRGWSIPVDLVPPALRERIDELHSRLGYPGLSADISDSLAFSARSTCDHRSRVHWDSAAIESIGLHIARQVAPRLAAGVLDHLLAGPATAIKLVIVDHPQVHVLDAASGQVHGPDHPASCTVLTDSATLLAVADGSLNAAVAFRRASIRIAFDSAQPYDAFLTYLDAIVALVSTTPALRTAHRETSGRVLKEVS